MNHHKSRSTRNLIAGLLLLLTTLLLDVSTDTRTCTSPVLVSAEGRQASFPLWRKRLFPFIHSSSIGVIRGGSQQQQHQERGPSNIRIMLITLTEQDATKEHVNEQLSKHETVILLATASFVPSCQPLLSELEQYCSAKTTSSGCCGDSDTAAKEAQQLTLLNIPIDACDELEELAIELGLEDVPSYQIYHKTQRMGVSSSGDAAVTLDSIRSNVEKALTKQGSSTGGCCPGGERSTSSSPCCPSPPGGDSAKAAAAPTDAKDVLKSVQEYYTATVNSKNGEGCCVSVDPSIVGYTPEQILQAGKDANLGLGCGNPINFANIQRGETVVDLGSGAGVDCFLASTLVGEEGMVIGIDMTPDMIHRARENARKRQLSTRQVQFRLGEIEHLPVADSVVDVVVSNCVINLSPDKPQVFREIHRILRPKGRIAISDVIIRPNKVIPEHLRTAEALAC